MHITFHRGKQDFSGRGGAFLFFRFNYRLKNGNGFLHGTGCFHHLGQKHFSGAKELTYIVHTCH